MKNDNEREVEGICRRWTSVEALQRMFCATRLVF